MEPFARPGGRLDPIGRQPLEQVLETAARAEDTQVGCRNLQQPSEQRAVVQEVVGQQQQRGSVVDAQPVDIETPVVDAADFVRPREPARIGERLAVVE